MPTEILLQNFYFMRTGHTHHVRSEDAGSHVTHPSSRHLSSGPEHIHQAPGLLAASGGLASSQDTAAPHGRKRGLKERILKAARKNRK